MRTEHLVVDPRRPDPADIARAADVLRRGGLVAFPTETVYGLGAHALDRAAVRRIFEAKGRPAHDPLIVHVAAGDQIGALARVISDDARRLAERFWPGPLTIVVPRAGTVPDEVTAGLDTVAIRVPAHPVARALLATARVPVAAPSANLFSRPSPTRAAHVLEDLGGRIDLVLDGGPTHVGLESTVVDLSGAEPLVLRPGAIALETLQAVLPAVRQRRPQVVASDAALPSPGLLDKHYAPRAPLTLYHGDPRGVRAALVDAARRAAQSGRRVGVLVMSDDVEAVRALPVELAELGPSGDAAAVAARLYAALRELDAAGVDEILVGDPPGDEGLWYALRDRLRRAAAHLVFVD